MAALCKLRESSYRGKLFNWNIVEETTDAVPHPDVEATKAVKASLPLSPVLPRPLADQCPFCFFDEGLSEKDRLRLYSRTDSLRLRVYLSQASRHNYGLRGLSRAYSHAPSRMDRSPIQNLAVVGWVSRIKCII
jgi:hypothetical protein